MLGVEFLQVGDISHGASQDGGQGITHVHAPLARLCKLHIELDRNESAHEVSSSTSQRSYLMIQIRFQM